MRFVFFLQKQVEILIKANISLFEYITKVYMSIFLLKSISKILTDLYSLLLERTNGTPPVYAIPIHQFVSFLAAGKL